MKYLKALALTILLGTLLTGCYTEFSSISKDHYAQKDRYTDDRQYEQEYYQGRYSNRSYPADGYYTYRYSHNSLYDPFYQGYLYRSTFFSPYLCNYCYRTSLINHRVGLIGFGFTPVHFGGTSAVGRGNKVSGPRGSGIFRSGSRTKSDLRNTERDRRTRGVRSGNTSSKRNKVKANRSRSSGKSRVKRSKSRTRSSGSRVKRSSSGRSGSGSNSGRTRSSGRDRDN